MKTTTTLPGLLLAGHGTREPVGVQQFLATVEQVRARLPNRAVAGGFLELAQPTLCDGLAELVAAGCRDVTVMPLLLANAAHAQEDIPAAVAAAAAQLGVTTVRQTAVLGTERHLLELSALRYRAAELISAPAGADTNEPIAADQTLWILVARGNRDPQVANVLRGFAAARKELLPTLHFQPAFWSVAEPRLTEVLAQTAAGPWQQVIVQAHFLFAGELPEKVRRLSTAAAAAAGHQRWLYADSLGPDPLLAEAVVARVAECEDQQLNGAPGSSRRAGSSP